MAVEVSEQLDEQFLQNWWLWMALMAALIATRVATTAMIVAAVTMVGGSGCCYSGRRVAAGLWLPPCGIAVGITRLLCSRLYSQSRIQLLLVPVPVECLGVVWKMVLQSVDYSS